MPNSTRSNASPSPRPMTRRQHTSQGPRISISIKLLSVKENEETLQGVEAMTIVKDEKISKSVEIVS